MYYSVDVITTSQSIESFNFQLSKSGIIFAFLVELQSAANVGDDS